MSEAPQGYGHEPVMVGEVLELLLGAGEGAYLDGTAGGGGHAEAILEAEAGARLLGLDRDPEAVAAARSRLARFGDRARIEVGDFRDAPRLIGATGWIDTRHEGLRGALLDLGVSSWQLDHKTRGFSFRPGTPLNMRMGGTTGGRRPAADLLNEASEAELGRIFREYGEERRWRALAREVVRRRGERLFRTSDDLMAAVTTVLGAGVSVGAKARLFQALRIAVNDELGALEEGLDGIRDLLGARGRLVVISYHSLEDRIVKHAFREWSRECVCPPELPVCRCRGRALGRGLTKSPLRPSAEEVARNPRARSGRLRAWEKAEG